MTIDLYLAGHGRATLGRPWVDGALVHMSRTDLILRFVSTGAALIAGWAIWRSSGGSAQLDPARVVVLLS